MLCALPALIVGILLGEWMGVSAVVAIAIFVLMLMLTLRYGGDYLLLLAIVAAGVVSATLRSAPSLPEHGEMEIEIRRIIRINDSRTTAQGRVVAFMHEGKSYRSRADVRISSDVPIEQGDRMLVVATARPFERSSAQGRYMAAQGFSAQIFISADNILHRRTAPISLVGRLQAAAERRISRLGLSPETAMVASAVSIGQRDAVTDELQTAYSLSGGAHLLAVSGLHVGFIFAILNLLLSVTTLLRGGQIIRSLMIVIAIWIYAALADFSPSVVRAATMFSIVQVAVSLYSSARSLNSLAFIAFVMLTIDARTLHDASFLLSVIAVAAILLWVAPHVRLPLLKDYYRPRWHDTLWRAGQSLYSSIAVSLAATVATQPLVSHLFGTMSLWSVVLAPLIIPLCGVAMATTIVWILMPLPLLQGVARWVIDNTVGAMNTLSLWAAERGSLSLDVTMSRGWCIGIYLLFILFTILLLTHGEEKNRLTKS
jgi:competence protein ComEC